MLAASGAKRSGTGEVAGVPKASFMGSGWKAEQRRGEGVGLLEQGRAGSLQPAQCRSG